MSTLRDRVTEHLVALGWQVISMGLFGSVIRKDFDTANGVRTADLNWPWMGDRARLSGVYPSEGRNALAGEVLEFTDEDTPDEVVEHRVRHYVVEIERLIDQTYARGLLLKYGYRAIPCVPAATSPG